MQPRMRTAARFTEFRDIVERMTARRASACAREHTREPLAPRVPRRADMRRPTHWYPNVSGFGADTRHCKTPRPGHTGDTFPALNTHTAAPDANTTPRARQARAPSGDANTFRSIPLQEPRMSMSKITFAFAALALTASAYAASPAETVAGNYDVQAASHWSPLAPMAKTRAEVRQELAAARQNGELDALRKLYSGH
ncbi:DUF4148 domain-containing protein [Burkholderia sp. AU28942]|uniref:DUF4148 domain-containing protein n=1 Tax=Burkholderia TaxID=32008 RepID=UPI001CF2A1F9|nr:MULTISPECIES: DUF4148 domain-containing protein [Burkholderia]MCA8308136.1 DUF4148 domain-containing protein [Burkholderia sp. AU28942]